MFLSSWFAPKTSGPASSSSSSVASSSSRSYAKINEEEMQPPPQQGVHHHHHSSASPSSSSSSSTSSPALAIVHLSPVQSCNLHGWTNPKRTLTWEDLRTNSRLTLVKCLQNGVSADDLRGMQPDVKMWIKHKKVSFGEVELMKGWPLHPVVDLRGNISDLAGMHYPPSVLNELGITYGYMREALRMDDEWMRMMRYKPSEWAQMGFSKRDAEGMGRKRVNNVFNMDYDCVLLSIAAGCDSLN